ncbi:hypothetical protein C8Q78DRAFT_977934, partial [Trametes maxima]
PPFRDGHKPTSKPKASDYEPHVYSLILRACHQYEALIATENAFPDLETQDAWATRVWTIVCTGANMFYKLTNRIKTIITGRGSHARGDLRDKIRPYIAENYGFSDEGTERAKVQNLARYNYLLDRDAIKPEPVFAFKDVEARTEFAHNRAIRNAIKATWFADPTGPGIIYAAQFSPIREETLALIFTTIEFCLDQWSDGTCNKNLALTQKAYESKYIAHLKIIRLWSQSGPEASKIVRQRMYDRARRACGAAPMTRPSIGLSDDTQARLRAELEAMAAEPGSDNE